MELLYIDKLPKGFGRNKLMRLLIEEGNFDKLRIGKIDVTGKRAIIELDSDRAARVAETLDGLLVGNSKIRAWHELTNENVDDHFSNQLRWLALEAKADQEKARSGNRDSETTLSRLVLVDEEVGLGGRVMVRFTPRNTQRGLPWTRLGGGSPVIVVEEGSKGANTWRGVITQIRKGVVEVALMEVPETENDDPLFRIQLSNDAIARQRMERALGHVSSARGNRLAELRDIILGKDPSVFSNHGLEGFDEGLISDLNPSQQSAVKKALSAEDIALVHGPPGTGKTTTLVSIIRAAVRRGDKVLACAPSNMAVDNLAYALVEAGETIVRIGHPARVQEQVLDFTLDAQVEQHENYRLAKRLRKQAHQLRTNAGKWKRARPQPGEKAAMREEAKQLNAEAYALEARAIERVLDNVPVVLSTLTALDSSLIGQRQFDLCVIDEAGQSTEAATWVPIRRSKRVVLAGDHLQLPPTILSREAEDEGFGISLLEHLMVRDGDKISQQLTVQYRMNASIMGFSSAEFYADSLSAHDSNAGHLLADLPGVSSNPLTTTALTYIDTAGASYDEKREPDGNSRLNVQEADLIMRKVDALIAAGVAADAIGIITPYAAQVRQLRERMQHDVEVNSVDGFQGREKEAILISLVRSNERGEVGFLAEPRRMNVALTRARRCLIVIGDSATISTEPFFGRLLDHWESVGAYKSVWEEMYE